MAGCAGKGTVSNGAENTDSSITKENDREDADLVKELINPISTIKEDEWYDYGTGDPYVMRYNGMYYLYMSTRDTEVGVKCFSSRDLINWDYEGLCTELEVTKGAYAPEVVYYNGKFYMYTSPAGKGHYVLESDSPTGPFKTVSVNLGFTIDGSVFIDDDGKWYFYHASDDGILAHEMSAPNKIEAKSYKTGAYMYGWTEGPMVIKTEGKYYLTYTGNHVFSDGYRIDAATGDSPVAFTPNAGNPVLISTIKDVVGIGHSSSVKGPDLDSYYIVYHSLIGRAVEGMPKRDMRIDRIAFGEDGLYVMGPTTTAQQAPAMADAYTYTPEPKGKTAFLDGSFEGDFTAEFNLALTGSEAGAYLCYAGEQDYVKVYVTGEGESIHADVAEAGNLTSYSFDIAGSFKDKADLQVNETYGVKRKGDSFKIFYNDRLTGEFTASVKDGSIGVYGDATFGYAGATRSAAGESIKSYEKPLPGRIDADAKIEGKEKAFLVRVAKEGIYDLYLTYGDRTEIKRGITLKAGTYEYELPAEVQGLKYFEVTPHEDVTAFTAEYDKILDDNVYSDGKWRIKGGTLNLTDAGETAAKRLYGSEYYGDYEASVDLTYEEDSVCAGLMVRATDPAVGGPGNSPSLGYNFFKGYAAEIQNDGLVLKKVRYKEEVLDKYPFTPQSGETYSLTVKAEGNELTVSLNGNVVLKVTDNDRPILNGLAGVRTIGTKVSFDSFSIK